MGCIKLRKTTCLLWSEQEVNFVVLSHSELGLFVAIGWPVLCLLASSWESL